MKRPKKPVSKPANRYYCRRLADYLGCKIECDRCGPPGDQSITYWVWPPNSAYVDLVDYQNYQRADPCEHSHSSCSWAEVWDKLLAYQVDLHLHRLCIGDKDSTCLADICCQGEAAGLFGDWLDDMCYGLVLADWLEDNQHSRLADVVRGACHGA